MSKQTAVEWLFNQIKKDIIGIEYDYADEFNQAKEMEKNQIINIFKDAQVFKVMNNKTRAEQYYNETYGGTNE
jgi:hypothetical protein